MRKKKGFDFGKGKYYLIIVDFLNNIIFYRLDKVVVVRVYEYYNVIGKKVEWLGKWDGKKFIEVKVL